MDYSTVRGRRAKRVPYDVPGVESSVFRYVETVFQAPGDLVHTILSAL